MALKDLIHPPTLTTERPPGITCPSYLRGEGKRCVHYAAGGGCALPTIPVCTEWLKRNGPSSAPPARSLPVVREPTPNGSQPRDLFGNPVPAAAKPTSKPTPTASPKPAAAPPAVIDVDRLRGFTTEDIESFKALGVEVQLYSEAYGELWLVPAYTDQPRRELTPENAATVMQVLLALPGAQVVAFNNKPQSTTTPKHERQERLEKRS